MVWKSDGHARTDKRHPSAFAICDFCYSQWNRIDLQADRQYMGTDVRPTGFLVCPRCLDKPQPQQKAIRIPPDPLPVYQPRLDIAPDGNLGFTSYQLVPNGMTGGFTPSAVLAQMQALTSIALPAGAGFQSLVFGAGNASQQVLAPNALRSYVLLFNPGANPVELSESTLATWGGASDVVIGSGQALFWATAQGGQVPYAGALSGIAIMAGIPLWTWEAPSSFLINPDGTVMVDPYGNPMVAP